MVFKVFLCFVIFNIMKRKPMRDSIYGTKNRSVAPAVVEKMEISVKSERLIKQQRSSLTCVALY